MNNFTFLSQRTHRLFYAMITFFSFSTIAQTFPCSEQLYVTRQVGANTQLGNFVSTGTDFNITTENTYLNLLLNASVYYEGYIYAFQSGSNDIYRLESGANVRTMFDIPGLPSTSWNNAGVSIDGVMYMLQPNTRTLWRINLETNPPSLIGAGTTITLNGALSGDTAANAIWGDIAVDPTTGIIYVWYHPTAANTRPGLYILNTTTNQLTLVGSTVSRTMGCLVFDETGRLYSYGSQLIGTAGTPGSEQDRLFFVNKATGLVTQVADPDTAVTQADGCNCAFSAGIELDGPGSALYSDCSTTNFDFSYSITNSSSITLNGVTVNHTIDSRFSITTSAATLQTYLRTIFGPTATASIGSSGGGTNNVLSVANLTLPLGTNTFTLAISKKFGAQFTTAEVISNTAILGGLPAALGVTNNSNDPETLLPNDATRIIMAPAATCLDYDNDGVRDNIDLDDDNDGILDTSEGLTTCSPFPNYDWNGTTITEGAAKVGNGTSLSNSLFIKGVNAETNYYNNSGVVTLNSMSGAGTNTFGLSFNDSDATITTQNNTGAGSSQNISYTIVYAKPTTVVVKWTAGQFTSTQDYRITYNSESTPTVSNPNSANVAITAGPVGQYYYDVTTSANQALANVDDWTITLTNVSTITVLRSDTGAGTAPNSGSLQFLPTAYCDLDTDNDNIPNAIDYDSDDDGCNDANEAYSSSTADGGDNNYYGTGNPPPTNANGTVVAASYSTPSGYEVTVGTPVAITTQPSASQRVNIGVNATFTAVTTGSIFQWQVSTDNGGNYTNVSGPSYSGANTSSLTVIATPLSFNGYRYRVVVASVQYACVTYSNNANAVLYVCDPAAPAASVTTQPTCGTGATITVSSPAINADLEFSRDGITYQASNIFTNVPPSATYSITVRRISNGCVTNPTSVIVGSTLGQPATPNLTIVQPTCSVTGGSITVNSPTGAAYEYSRNNTTWQAGTIFSGLAPGAYTIYVRRTADISCVSTNTANISSVPTPPAAPTASTTIQPTCTADGTIVVTAPTDATFEYSRDGINYQSSTTFTNVPSGSHSITVRRTNDTTCISSATNVTVNAKPSVPASPTLILTQPTCTTATGTITVTAPLGANLEYSRNGSTFQASVTFNTVPTGSYNITVRNTSTSCTSVASAVTLNAQPSAPTAPTASTTVQPTCAVATGTIVVSSPAQGTGFEYSIDGGAYQASATFTATAGNHDIRVRRTSDNTCISGATTVSVNAQPSAPTAPTASTTVQPTCAVATGTIVVSSPAQGTGFEYSIDGGAYQASATFTATAGNHDIRVRRTSDNTCISGATTVSVNAQPSAPTAPTASTTVQPTCAVATGTIVVSSPAQGTGFEYSIDGGAYQASATFTATVGNHDIRVRRTSDNTCISGATTVSVNAQPSAPTAPTASTTVQPTCAVSTGTIVVSSPAQGTGFEYSIDGGAYQASATFTATVGNHDIRVRRTSDNTCISGATTVSVNAQPSAPTAPTASTTVQPTCAVSTGTIVVSSPAQGTGFEYSIDGGAYQASATFTATVGNHDIRVRRTSDNTCISGATTVSVNAQPSAPTAPTASTTVQPTCAVATGTIVVSSPAQGTGFEYSIDGGAYQASATFTATAGNHDIRVRRTSDNTCISGATTVSVNAQPSAPTAPTASTTVQPTCAVATGTIVVSSPAQGTGFEYSIDGEPTRPQPRSLPQRGTTISG